MQVPENYQTLIDQRELRSWLEKRIADSSWPGTGFAKFFPVPLDSSHGRDIWTLECPYCLGLEPVDGDQYIVISNIWNYYEGIERNEKHTREFCYDPPEPSTSISKLELEWLKGIEEERGIRMVYQYIGDGFHPETNTIFEFYGDSWHGNPDLYAPTDFPCDRRPLASARLLHLETMNKEQTYRRLGFKYETIWESEFKQRKQR